jgi:RNA polymerase sigma-70 factor (ECF subfamily)
MTAEAEEPPDSDLLARLGGGDRDALAPLMERHYHRLYRIALGYLRDPEEALDAVQETFVKAFRHAPRRDGACEAGPWLTRIAINQSIDLYRRRKRRRAAEEPLDSLLGDHDGTLRAEAPVADRLVAGREVSERVSRALAGLGSRPRAVFVLRHYQGLTLEEIAQTLRMSLGTVKSSLHRTVHRLRAELQELT